MFKKALVLLGLVACNFAFAAVEINKASEADLDGLKGVGPATSQQILTERKKGDFKNWADLMTRVKGIGPARADKLSAQGLTVAGASYGSGKSAARAKDPSTTPSKPAAVSDTHGSKAPPEGKDDKNARSGKAAKEAGESKEVRKQG